VADPVLSLAAARDTLWVGSTAGLRVLAPGADQPEVPAGAAATPALRDPIVALARSADTLVAATPDQLAWRDPAGGAWTVLRPRADLGRLTALAGDAGGAWVGGTQGLAFWDIARGSFHALRVPLDLPAAVRDVTVAPPWLWVATDSGLVRFDRRAALGR
jgi:ligand-binding sensor domain-containing protein